MIRSYWFCFLFTGLAIAGCGSSSSSPPDANMPYDAGGGTKHDAAIDAPITDASPTVDAAGIDTLPVHDAAIADVAIDSGGGGDLGTALDSAHVDASAVDVAGTVDVAGSEGGGEAGSIVTYTAVLTGAQEVPPVVTTATGSATFTLSADRTQLMYLVTHDVVGGTASHIHLAAAGENGAIVYPFTPFGSTMSGTLTITATDADNLEQGKMYVNVHSTSHPGGEIRGQILHPGDSLWVATLTGSQETPPVTSTGTGTAAVILDAAKTSLRYHVNTTGLTLTNAHIHKGIATIAGAVIHPFSPIAAVMDGTIALSGTDAQDLAAGLWYVNVHTAANPGGELRGQLMMPGEVLYSASLSGANEVPPVTTSATGGAQFILDPQGTSLRYQAAFTGLITTGSDVNMGAAGVNGNVLYPLTLTANGAAGTQTMTAGDLTNLNAGNLYVSVQTATNPGGEIRGQIGKP